MTEVLDEHRAFPFRKKENAMQILERLVDNGWDAMVQTIGDTAAKWWLGVCGVVTAAGILWAAAFAFQSSIAMQRLIDKQDSMAETLHQVQDDIRDLRQRVAPQKP